VFVMSYTKRFAIGTVIICLTTPIIFATGLDNRIRIVIALILVGTGFFGFQVPALVQACREQRALERNFHQGMMRFEVGLAQLTFLVSRKKKSAGNGKSSRPMVN